MPAAQALANRVQKTLAVVAATSGAPVVATLDAMAVNDLVRFGYATRVWDGRQYVVYPTAARNAAAGFAGIPRPGRRVAHAMPSI
jgi:hypothetical protein